MASGGATTAASALVVRDLRLSYSGQVALEGVSLEVAAGEFVALLGPSGCGKTSLLRSVAGFVTPDRGEILIGGRHVRGVPPRRRNLGIVFQDYALFPHMTAAENVGFGLECRGLSRENIRARTTGALRLVGLENFAHRRPGELSGGQQQRVALARAVVIEPDLLLLDEPLGALDKQLRSQMQLELKDIQKRLGVTALFVTHDQEEAMSMADRIVVMRAGRIEQVDTPETLFTKPRTSWVCEFIGGGTLLEPVVEPTGAAYVDVGPSCRIQVDPQQTGAGRTKAFIRSDRIRLAPDHRSNMTVIGRRFLGAQVELSVQFGASTIRAMTSLDEARQFPIGARVTASAARADCHLVADV